MDCDELTELWREEILLELVVGFNGGGVGLLGLDSMP